jgi:hypothetical protein
MLRGSDIAVIVDVPTTGSPDRSDERQVITFVVLTPLSLLSFAGHLCPSLFAKLLFSLSYHLLVVTGVVSDRGLEKVDRE